MYLYSSFISFSKPVSGSRELYKDSNCGLFNSVLQEHLPGPEVRGQPRPHRGQAKGKALKVLVVQER